MKIERQAKLETNFLQVLLADLATTGLVVMLERSLQRLKIVVIRLLKLLPYEGDYPSVSVLPPQEPVRVSHVNQVPCSELVWFHKDSECVRRIHIDGVTYRIVNLTHSITTQLYLA